MEQIDLFSLIVGVLAGFLIGWIVEWLIDSRNRRRDIEIFDAELARIQSEYDHAETARVAIAKERDAAQERIKGLTAGNATLDEQLAIKRREVSNLEAELGTSEAKLRQMAATEQANQRLRSKLTEYESQIRNLESKCKTLENDTKDMKSLREQLSIAHEQIELLNSEKQTLRDKLATAEAEMATIGAQMQTASEDLSEVETLRTQSAEAQREIERLRANLAAATAQNERGSAMNLENNELRARLESAENELLDSNNRLVAADVQLQNVTDQLTDQRMRADMLQKELAALQGDGAPLLTAETTQLKAQLGAAKSQIEDLRSELASAKADTALINVLKAENSDLRAQLSGPAAASTTAVSAPAETNGAGDRLQSVNGIGNVFARRLNEAGVMTFGELAALSPERLVEIVQAKPWQNVDPEGWIEQAAALAADGGVA